MIFYILFFLAALTTVFGLSKVMTIQEDLQFQDIYASVLNIMNQGTGIFERNNPAFQSNVNSHIGIVDVQLEPMTLQSTQPSNGPLEAILRLKEAMEKDFSDDTEINENENIDPIIDTVTTLLKKVQDQKQNATRIQRILVHETVLQESPSANSEDKNEQAVIIEEIESNNEEAPMQLSPASNDKKMYFGDSPIDYSPNADSN